MSCLGHIYETGGWEDDKTGKFYPLVKKNLEIALPLYTKAAELGDELALNFQGAHLFNVSKNEGAAVEMFKKATSSGKCARALNNLGLCFEFGISVQADL